MIRSFADPQTERIWNGERSRRFPQDMQDRALSRLRMLNRAKALDDLRNPPGNRLHALKETVRANTAFPSTCNGVYALSGAAEAQSVSKSQTITNPDWLHNPHAGEMLALEFMEPLGLSAAMLAEALGTPASVIESVISGDIAMTGDLDLRLSRYFRMSEGFFLGLQTNYELLEARRALNGELDKIIPRAA